MRNSVRSTVGVMLSGGTDSAVLLAELLRRGDTVVPFYVQSGCVWEPCELAAVHAFLAAMKCQTLSELIVLEMSVTDLYGGHWSVTGESAPDQFTSDEAVFLPGRNPLLLLKPALWCEMRGIEQLALATLAANPFDDATPAFFASFAAMIHQATGERVEIVRPFETLMKRSVMALGRHLPLELTFSCIAPVGGMHCGQCNKCGERQAGFRNIAMRDRTHYANRVQSAVG